MSLTPSEQLRRWAFSAGVLVMAVAGSLSPLTSELSPRPPESAPSRSPGNPFPGVPDSAVRDPFLTGTEWRAKMRAKLEPPIPVPSASASARRAPEPLVQGPDLLLLGTMEQGDKRFAVMATGEFAEGSKVGRYRVEKVETDRVTFEHGGQRLVIKVPASSAVTTVSTATGR